MKKLPRHAFLLVLVLFLIVILVIMGFGFLGSRVSQYQSTGKSVAAAQARAVARAGIEDARAKLNLDVLFPPTRGINQNQFTYSEDLRDAADVEVLGSYRVTIDSTVSETPPYFILSITSVGQAGPRNAPLARHTYRAFVDVSPIKVPPSPTYFQIIRFDDVGEN